MDLAFIHKLNTKQLKAELHKRGLSKQGNKDVLVSRLFEAEGIAIAAPTPKPEPNIFWLCLLPFFMEMKDTQFFQATGVDKDEWLSLLYRFITTENALAKAHQEEFCPNNQKSKQQYPPDFRLLLSLLHYRRKYVYFDLWLFTRLPEHVIRNIIEESELILERALDV